MKIEKVVAYRLSIPFIEETVVPFHRHRIMDSVILKVFSGNHVGISETTGNPGFSGESAEGILAALDRIVPSVLGSDPREFRKLHEAMDCVVGNPAAKAGVDTACYDLAAKHYNVSIPTLLGGKVHEKVQTQHLLPIKPIEEIVVYARNLFDEGYRIFEVKTETDPVIAAKRISAIQEAVNGEAVLIIDLNRSSTVPDTIKFLSKLDPENLYIEQPVDSIRQMAEVRRRSSIPVIADELVKSLADAVNIIEAGAADMLSLKLVKVGGFLPAMQIAAYADSIGVPFRVDDMCMSRLGNTASFVFAQAWNHVFGCGFAQHTLLVKHEDIVPRGIDVCQGWAENKNKIGVGAEINFDLLGEPVAEWSINK